MIRLENASLWVRDASDAEPRVLLEPTDFSLAPGERHLILGRNGSGKTTLLRLLSGLVPPSTGRVLLDGNPIHEPGRRETPSLWPRVAVVFEEPDPQFLGETVTSEIAFGLESMALAPDETRRRVAEALEAHGLEHLAARDPRSLSAGEKVRTLLAAALAAHPAVLLLDQCLAHLDPTGRRAAEAQITATAAAGGLCVARASQDAEPPAPGEAIHVLESGRLRDARSLDAAAVAAARAVPLPLALRASAALALDGRWSGPLSGAVPEFLAALERGGERSAAGGGGPLPHGSDREPARGATGSGAGALERDTSPETLLSLEGVSWRPHGAPALPPVVEDVTLCVGRGEIVALVGASGSGKTTLLSLAAGLLEPTRGRIERADPPVRRMPAVALALEYPERQLFARSVAEDVAASLWIAGVPPEERARRAVRAIQEVGLDPHSFAERIPATLSEGEKRRAALAAFLIEPPLVLLLDEPTAGLDPEGRRALKAALLRLKARERGIVIASHDLDFVSGVADRLIVVGREPAGPGREQEGPGRVLGGGAPPAVWRDEKLLAAACLPAPDYAPLAAALRARGWLPSACVRDADSLLEALARTTAPLMG